MTIISPTEHILTFRQTGQVKLKCKIRLDRLLPDQKSRERFDHKWKKFIKDSCNNDIYRLQGNTLSYDSEQLIPTKTNRNPPLLLVLGNPASESVKRGMFFATGKDGKELRFWKHILEKAKFIPLLPNKNLSALALNQSRKRQLLNPDGEAKFRIGLSIFISMPSAAGGKWNGVAGIQKLLGTPAFRMIEKEETKRIINCARKFVQNNGAIITFQKNAWESLRSENDPVYTIDRAKNGELIGHLKGNEGIHLYGVAPTRLNGPCSKTLKQIGVEIEGQKRWTSEILNL